MRYLTKFGIDPKLGWAEAHNISGDAGDQLFPGFPTGSVPYELSDREIASSIEVIYVDDHGYTDVKHTSYEDGHVVFETAHFSYYSIHSEFESGNDTIGGVLPYVAALIALSAVAVVGAAVLRRR